VFAVLITVLVLELRPSEAPTFHALLLLWPTWLSYAVSYLFIAIGRAGRDVLVVTQ
jgi:TMEM175 potassium channel family protein